MRRNNGGRFVLGGAITGPEGKYKSQGIGETGAPTGEAGKAVEGAGAGAGAGGVEAGNWLGIPGGMLRFLGSKRLVVGLYLTSPARSFPRPTGILASPCMKYPVAF